MHTLQLVPANTCILCGKTLEEVGGRRLTAQHFKGISYSSEQRVSGKRDEPCRSFQLTSTPLYLNVWGEEFIKNEIVIQKIIKAFHRGYRAWLCQQCGCRLCAKCGSPLERPMGYDILHDDGSDLHCGILPTSAGCVNPLCTNHRK